ncbi:MAG: hypothetical protein AAF620_14175 [Bacteroidota bacterium]
MKKDVIILHILMFIDLESEEFYEIEAEKGADLMLKEMFLSISPPLLVSQKLKSY